MYTANPFVAFEKSATIAPKPANELNPKSILSIHLHHHTLHFNIILPLSSISSKYTRPSLSANLYFAVSQIRGDAQRIKTHHSNSSMDTDIKIFRQLERIIRAVPHDVQGAEAKKAAAPNTMFLQK
jgi:hypothetical protein